MPANWATAKTFPFLELSFSSNKNAFELIVTNASASATLGVFFLNDVSTNVAITGILAGVVYACASFAQVLVGWLIDRISPRLVLFWISVGQILFIFLASKLENLSLFFLSIAAMCFVFGQIPITDTILVRYIPDIWRSRVLSAKFLLNLCIAASVLPITSLLLQRGFELKMIFSLASIIAIGVLISSILLPKQSKELNPNI